MELSEKIKSCRADMNLSQEDLAEKIYVSRQTISNWENGKNYPDIHSLLSLSALFNVSLDQLLKGDVEVMKKEINEVEIKRLKRYSGFLTVLMVVIILSIVPLMKWLSIYAIIPTAVLFGIAYYFSSKIERVKKENDIHTYKEIVSFLEGKRLDEIKQQQEIGKRPYQKILLALGSGAITLLVCLLIWWLM